MIGIIVMLAILLAGSMAVNVWLLGLLEETHRDSEQDWADPAAIREVDES